MNARPAIIFLALFVLTIVQTGFLNHFIFFNDIWLQVANPVALLVFVYGLLERRQGRLSWAAAVWGGLLLDLHSNMYFGVWIVSLSALIFIIKVIVRRYVSIPTFW